MDVHLNHHHYDIPSTTAPRLATVAIRGHTQYYNPTTGDYSNIKPNLGHWGPNIGTGCGKVRNGKALPGRNIYNQGNYMQSKKA